MERRRNFLPLAGFLVCLAAFLSYFLFFYQFPVTRDVPWTAWLLFAVGLALLAAGLRRAFRRPAPDSRPDSRPRGRVTGTILGVLSLFVLAVFLLFTVVESRKLPASASAPKVGQKAPDFTLQDAQGKNVRLVDLLGSQAGGAGPPSWVVLIFYRGHW